MLRRIAAFVVAVILMVVLGSAAHSFFVQLAWSRAAGLADATGPASIPFIDRVTWVFHDLFGMIVLYSALTSAALLIAFLAAGLVARFSGGRVAIFGLAGAAALFTMFTLLRVELGTVGIFGARGIAGLGAQMAVGLLAGVLFARLTAHRPEPGAGT